MNVTCDYNMSNSQRQRNMASMEHPTWSLRDGIRVCACIIIIIFTLGIKDPEGFGKIEENYQSDPYSGQSSNTKESYSSTPLNRCISTETRWNKKLSLPE